MNIGIIIFTHNQLAEGLINTLYTIVGKKDKVTFLSVTSNCTLDFLCEELKEEIKKLSTDYVIVFTDMLGGTPCNVALKVCKEQVNNLYIISGVNLYMLISAVNLRENGNFKDIKEYVEKIVQEGKNNIVDVNEFFNRKLKKI